ncbi:MAG: DUF3788 family protein [Bacteroidota bacterium]|nr:DUF3788 family protein [Bacteroidota bacterium]
MEESERLVLGDKNVYPSDEKIFSIIGDIKDVWLMTMKYVKDNYEGSIGEWRFYNDGNQWLFKMQYKKKTLFWIGVLENTFRITFYFGNKGEPVITSSTLPDKIKNDFVNGKRYGNIRAISLKVSGISDLENIYKLINLKAKLK